MMRTTRSTLMVWFFAGSLAIPGALAQEGETADGVRGAEKKKRDFRSSGGGAPAPGGPAKSSKGGATRRDMRQGARGRRQERRRDMREGRREKREERRDMRKENRAERRDMRKENRAERRDTRKEKREERRDMRNAVRRDRRAARRRDFRSKPQVSSLVPRGGPVGTKVVVRGRNFAPGTTVHLNGVLVADTVKVSPGRIAFKVPSGATDGLIVLKVPGMRRELVVGRFNVKKRDMVAVKKRRKERLERARARWSERKKRLAKSREERRAAFEASWEERRKSRAERRRKRAERLRAKWQREFLARPQVQTELSLHAERKARLVRMRELADIDGREKLIVRIEVLIDREDERHERRMDLFKVTFKN